MTGPEARAIAEQRTRHHIERKAKEAAVKTYSVEVCIKATLTVLVDAPSEDDAQDLAHDATTESIAGMFFNGAHWRTQVKEDDRAIHRIAEVRPVRTVMVDRHIGGGVFNSEGQDE